MSRYLQFFETAWIVFQEQLTLFPNEEKRLIRIGDHIAEKENKAEALGVISEVSGDLVFVDTPKWMRERQFPFPPETPDGWIEIAKVVRVPGYSFEQLAQVIYGRFGYHSICRLQRSYFDGWQHSKICCQHKDCKKAAVGVGIVNNLGTVMPFAMCVKHTEYHGMCCEYVPFTGKVRELVYA